MISDGSLYTSCKQIDPEIADCMSELETLSRRRD